MIVVGPVDVLGQPEITDLHHVVRGWPERGEQVMGLVWPNLTSDLQRLFSVP